MLKIFKINSTVIVNVFLALAIVLLLANIITANGIGSPNSLVFINIFKDPIVLSIAGGILTFLLVDRWRRLESEISEIRQNQVAALKDIREDAKIFTQDNIDITVRKAQVIEEHINGLLEDHPWISDITENEFIPDASSCKIIQRTAEDLLIKGKLSLVYEYLFSWTKHKDKKPSIEGSADDFLDLAEFCERILGDEYLGFLILREGVSNAINGTLLLPDYLKRLVRHGRFFDVEKTSKQLKDEVDPDWYTKIVYFLQRRRFYQSSRFLNRAYMSLALSEAISGDVNKSIKYLNQAKQISNKIGSEDNIVCVEAEMSLVFGEFASAHSFIEKLKIDETTSDDSSYEIARIYRALGNIDKYQELMELVFNRYQVSVDNQYKIVQNHIYQVNEIRENENSVDDKSENIPGTVIQDVEQLKSSDLNVKPDEISKSV